MKYLGVVIWSVIFHCCYLITHITLDCLHEHWNNLMRQFQAQMVNLNFIRSFTASYKTFFMKLKKDHRFISKKPPTFFQKGQPAQTVWEENLIRMLLLELGKTSSSSKPDSVSLHRFFCFSACKMGTCPFSSTPTWKNGIESQTLSFTNFLQLFTSVNIQTGFAAGCWSVWVG